MVEVRGIRMKNPAHPGGFVKSEVIEALELSVTDAARALGVTRAALSAVLNERARLSPEMALRIEKAFGVSMDTLMRMQNSYDIAQARMRADEIKVALFES
jgi:addiction module HigA family antidote